VRIMTGGTGGASDFAGRALAQALTPALGQSVVIENRGSVIAAELVARAPADGYTLLLHGSAVWLRPLLQESAGYDVLRDFTPVTWASKSPNMLVVHPALPVRSVKELIALAKARPGALNYSCGSVGGSSFVAPELFKAMTGAPIVRVAYKADTQEITDLLSGEVQLTFGAISALAPHVRAGKLRALAVTSAEPSALFPSLPTIAAAGVPAFEAISILGIWVPGGTPAAIVQLLNRESVKALQQPEIRQRFLSVGVEAVGSSPDAFAAKIRSEIAKWGKVFRNAGIKAD